MTDCECRRYLVMPLTAQTPIWRSVCLVRSWMDHWRNSTTLECWWDTILPNMLFEITVSYSHWLKRKIFLGIIYFLRIISRIWPVCLAGTSTATRVDRAFRSVSRLICRIGEDSKHVSTVFVWVILGRCPDTLRFILILYCFTAFPKLLICLDLWIPCISSLPYFSPRRHLWALSIFPCCGGRILGFIPNIQFLVMSQDTFHVLGRLWLLLGLLMLPLLHLQVPFYHVHWLQFWMPEWWTQMLFHPGSVRRIPCKSICYRIWGRWGWSPRPKGRIASASRSRFNWHTLLRLRLAPVYRDLRRPYNAIPWIIP